MEELETVGRRLKYAREDRLLTQKALAEAASVNYRHVAHIEQGRYKPRPETAKRLAAVLGINARWLLLGRGAMEAPAGEARGSGAGDG